MENGDEKDEEEIGHAGKSQPTPVELCISFKIHVHAVFI